LEVWRYLEGQEVQEVQEVHREPARGRTEVLDADLSAYPDTMPRTELMTGLARRIADGAVLSVAPQGVSRHKV
jgi:hypothetical protein